MSTTCALTQLHLMVATQYDNNPSPGGNFIGEPKWVEYCVWEDICGYVFEDKSSHLPTDGAKLFMPNFVWTTFGWDIDD